MVASLAATSCGQVREAAAPPPATASIPPAASLALAANAVPVELFLMSQCPYGVQAVNAIKPALDRLGPDVALSLDFIGDLDADGNASSMHGPSEVAGDIAQLCAAKHAPARFLDMVVCQNENVRDVATNWRPCAERSGLPVAEIATCVEGSEGKALLAASFARSAARGATGSPTILVAGREYEGRRSADAFLRGICAARTEAQSLQSCKGLPEPSIVNVILVGDNRCTDCETDKLASLIRARITRPNLQVVDYGEAKGKALWSETGGGNVPFLLFDGTLDADDEAREMVAEGLRAVGQYRRLDLGSTFNPQCVDDGGCKLPACAQTFACRAETPRTLELFVMSQCPYGVLALNAMKEVLGNFGPRMDFRIHYIAEGTAADGFRSLHGQPEVDENIRALCAIKSSGRSQRFMDYILCRNKNVRDPAWEGCATGAISAVALRRCVEREGAKLHEDDIAIANALGIGASPTWVVNGRHTFSGIDAETIRRNFCEHNAGTAGCEKTLSGPPDTDAPSSGGCGE